MYTGKTGSQERYSYYLNFMKGPGGGGSTYNNRTVLVLGVADLVLCWNFRTIYGG
jgi:hypothetical protein